MNLLDNKSDKNQSVVMWQSTLDGLKFPSEKSILYFYSYSDRCGGSNSSVVKTLETAMYEGTGSILAVANWQIGVICVTIVNRIFILHSHDFYRYLFSNVPMNRLKTHCVFKTYYSAYSTRSFLFYYPPQPVCYSHLPQYNTPNQAQNHILPTKHIFSH